MGFSGMRAVVLIVVFVALLIGIHKFDLPRWSLAVGLVVTAVALKATEKKAS